MAHGQNVPSCDPLTPLLVFRSFTCKESKYYDEGLRLFPSIRCILEFC